MKIVITLNSIKELDDLLSLKTRNKVSNFELPRPIQPTEEDGEAVAYFAEELSKIMDKRNKPKSTTVISRITEEDD